MSSKIGSGFDIFARKNRGSVAISYNRPSKPVLTQQVHDRARIKEVRAYAVLLLTVLAPTLGGATELWAQSIILIGAGLLLLLSPPRRSLGPIANVLFALLLGVALSAFLPAAWFKLPDWRLDLLKLGALLPATRSPQPWLTLQWTCFLLLALAWAYYLATFRWNHHLRRNCCIVFGLAILALSAALVFGFVTKLRIPFWPATPNFGFFPNRNQTSNVLGLGAVIIYAIGLQQFQEGRKYWWLWFASLSLVCWALIIDGSRAGIVLFFLGALAVHLYWWSGSRDRRQAMVAFGGLLLLVALFIIDGGATLARFQNDTAGFLEVDRNFRFSIYRDACNLIAKSSPLGVGLGNFWPIFAINRHYSANISQTAHPESDWLWGAIDVGWLGILITVALFGWWLVQCFPFAPGTSRLLRVAAMICGIAFAFHGILDVSGHRLGTLFPALFFGSLAISPQNPYRDSKSIPMIFRGIGALLLVIGLCWTISTFGVGETIPTTATIEQLRSKARQAIESQDFERAEELSSEGLQIAPLDWNFYFPRGLAEARAFDSRKKVSRDFAIAQYLLPNWPELYRQQGAVWLDFDEPELAFATWENGIRRLPESATALYSDIYGFVRDDPDLRERWRQLADKDRQRLMVFLRQADGDEFQIELQELLAEDQQLRVFTDEDLKTLFAQWYAKGDKLWMAELLQQHPEWKKLAWPELARAFADYHDYRQAFETASAFLVRPGSAHDLAGNESQIEQRFRENPRDTGAGIALAQAQASHGDIDGALSTLLAVRALPGAPLDLPLIEGQFWAQKREWQRAWQAIQPLIPAQ